MKRKIVSLLLLSAIIVCSACSKQEDISVSVAQPSSEIVVEEFIEETTEAVLVEEIKSVEVKTLQDIVLEGDYLQDTEIDLETQVEEFTEQFSEEQSSEEQTEGTDSGDWGAAVYKALGIHMPYLDDWYSYIKSDITSEDGVFKFTETGTKDMSKTFTIEVSENPLYSITGGKGSGEYVEIEGVQYKYYIDSDSHLELICFVDNVYFRFISKNIELDEYLELINHIVALI